MTIVVMETTQDREGDNASRAHCLWFHRPCSRRDRLPDPLMGPGAVAVRDIRPEHTPQVGLARDQEVIQALPPHAAEAGLRQISDKAASEQASSLVTWRRWLAA